jgi:hypothetical protein
MRTPSDVLDEFELSVLPVCNGQQVSSPCEVDCVTEPSQRGWQSNIRLVVLVAAATAAWGVVFLILRVLIDT